MGRCMKETATTKTIFKQLGVYVPTQYANQFIGFFIAICLRRFLGPFYMGVWSAMQVLMSYVSYAQLGTMTTVVYQVPMLNGQGKTEEAKTLQQVIFSFVSATLFLSSIGIALAALILRQKLPTAMFVSLLATSVILLCQRSYSFHVAILRATKDFKILSRVILFDSACNLVLVLLVVSQFKLYGFLAIAAVLPLMDVWLISRHKKLDWKFQWDFRRLASYIRYGLPIYVRDFLTQILNSLDRLMIVAFLGIEQLGIFSIVTIARGYGEGAYRNFSHVINPYFLEEFGRSQAQSIYRYVLKPTVILAYFMSFL